MAKVNKKTSARKPRVTSKTVVLEIEGLRVVWKAGARSATLSMSLLPEPARKPAWTGPVEGDMSADGTSLNAPVPGERWPFGPPNCHQDCCLLHTGGLWCDCAASASDDTEWGAQA